MKGQWTEERKAKQRAAIYRWRPWEKSTGPKSLSGKKTVGANAFKHGGRSRVCLEEMRAIRATLRNLVT